MRTNGCNCGTPNPHRHTPATQPALTDCGICHKPVTLRITAIYDRGSWVHDACTLDNNYDTTGE